MYACLRETPPSATRGTGEVRGPCVCWWVSHHEKHAGLLSASSPLHWQGSSRLTVHARVDGSTILLTGAFRNCELASPVSGPLGHPPGCGPRKAERTLIGCETRPHEKPRSHQRKARSQVLASSPRQSTLRSLLRSLKVRRSSSGAGSRPLKQCCNDRKPAMHSRGPWLCRACVIAPSLKERSHCLESDLLARVN